MLAAGGARTQIEVPMSNRRVGFVVVAGMLVGAGLLTGRTALADDAFQVTLTPSGGGAPVRASGDRLLPLLRDAVQSRGAFSSLQGKAFDGSVRYGEVPDAVHLTRDAAATTATMSSRLSGLQKSFAAANPAQLQKEVTGYVQSGANAYSDLLSAIDRNSALGLIDGNP